MNELIRIINTELDQLYEIYETSNKINKINELKNEQSIIYEVKKYIENLTKYNSATYLVSREDINEVFNLIFDEKEKKQLFYNATDIFMIKNILEGIHLSKMAMELTENQYRILEHFNNSLNKKNTFLTDEINKLNKEILQGQENKDLIENEIINLEDLLEKIENNEVITQEDFETIEKIIINPKYNLKTKINILIQIKQYNDNIINKKESLDIEKLKEVLEKEYGFGPKIIKLIEKHKEEISSKGKIDNIRRVLDYLKLEDESCNKKDILLKFDNESLIVLMIYATVESIKETYNKIINKSINDQFIYEVPSAWIINTKKTRKKRIPSGVGGKKEFPLANIAKKISYDEIQDNIVFLNSVGIQINDTNIEGNKKLLLTPTWKIKENFEIYKDYNIEIKDAASALSFSTLFESIDKMIEVGLLEYIQKYPTRIKTINPGVLPLLFKYKNSMSQYEYEKTIFSESRPGCLKNTITTSKDIPTKEEEENYLINSGAYIYKFDKKEERKEYLLRHEEIVNVQNALSNPIINMLENNFKKNEYIYEFNGQIISRHKVLRRFTILSKEKELITDDLIMFCLTYNTMINKTNFDYIDSIITDSKRVVRK